MAEEQAAVKPISQCKVTEQHIIEGLTWRIALGKYWQPCQGTKKQRFKWRNVLLREYCVYCGKKRGAGLDHILARSQKGPNGWHNRAPACAKCDKAKGCLPVLLFLVQRSLQNGTGQSAPTDPA